MTELEEQYRRDLREVGPRAANGLLQEATDPAYHVRLRCWAADIEGKITGTEAQ